MCRGGSPFWEGGSDSSGVTSPSYLFEAGLWEAGESQNPEVSWGNAAKDGCPLLPFLLPEHPGVGVLP